MAQHDYNIANQTGANFRTDLNNALSAIVSNNSGSSEPSTMYAYEWWIDTSANVLKLRNSSNNAWITMPFSITADNTVDINAGTVNGITSLSFSSGATVTSILDEDNLGSDSATALATQQSIKAYVDSQVTAQDLDISDGSSTIAIDLDSETLSLLGGTGVTSAASGNGVTFSIGQSVGTSDNVVFNQVTGALVGNASTATALATARTISGVSFDGTANITLDTDDIGEGSSNKYFTAERVDDQVNTLLTAGANISLTYDDAAGTLTIANTNSADITSVVAGDGLTGGGTSGDVTLAVGVDDSSIEISSDALRVKATGITNAMLAGSIANAKLANSSITVNSQAIALGGSHTFDTDDIGEGSSNLYYTDARANSAIDARVTNTFINNLSGVVADTATALATGRTIALSGDVTASGVSFDGTGNITLSTTIAANSVALGTDTTGNYVATIADAGNTRITVANSGSESAAITLDIADDAIGTDQLANNAVALGTQSTGNYVATVTGTTNEIEVSGSGSETATVTIGLPDDVTISGNLTVNGTTTTVNSDTLSVTDPLIKLAKANSGADSLDIGFYGLYDTSGSQDLYAGLFRDANDSGKFKLFKDLQVEPTTTVNTSGTGYAVGTLVSNLEGNVTGNVTGTVSSISNHSTSDLSEGTNLYYTDARFDTRLGTKTTDNLTEGSSNLYMTTERVQDIVGGMVTGNTETGITVTYDDSDGTLDFVVGTLNQDTTGNAATATALETARTIGGVSFDGTGNIDLAGVNTTGNQDTSGNAATATALATGRTIGMTGDVVWTSASFDGSGNVTGTATIQPNSVALSTDTTGDYVSTITAGTGLTSTGATSGEGIAHTLSVDAAQTQITSVGTLTSLTVDDITIDGSTISDSGTLDITSGADFTIDSAADITLDAGGGDWRYKDDGTTIATWSNVSGTYQVKVNTQDADFKIIGDDGGSEVTALTLDMSDAGAAQFNSNVGIGTAPTSTLHLKNGGRDLNFILADSPASGDAGVQITAGASDFIGIFGGSSNGELLLGSNGAEKMRIDSSGNVGIGQTSPDHKLTVNASAFDGIQLQSGGSDCGYLGVNTDTVYVGAGSNLIFHTGHAGLTNGTERMRIGSSGNVGIGDTSPDRKLHITDTSGNHIRVAYNDSFYYDIGRQASDGRLSISDNVNGETFSILPSGVTSVTHVATAHTNGLNIINGQTGGYGSALNLQSKRSDNSALVTAARIRTEGTEAWNADDAVSSALIIEKVFNNSLSEIMRFVSNGRGLIGTSSVLSSNNGGGLDVFATGGGPHVMNLKNSDTSGGANQIRFIDGSGDVCGEINSNATNNTTSYGTSSDGRYKDVIGEARGLEIINSLNPVKFTWKSSGEEDEGLIAQEVLEIVPNAITGGEETKYMMDYSKLVTPLIKAIQEQQEQIDALQSEINILKGE